MTIYRTGRTWRYDFRMAGVRYSRRGFRTKAEAQQAESAHRARVLVGLTGEWSSFADLVADWIEALRGRGVGMHYQQQAVAQFDKWLAPLSALPPREIRPIAVQRLLAECARRTSPQNANAIRRMLKACFNFGCRMGSLDVNPAKAVQPFPEPQKRAEDVAAIPTAHLRAVMLASPGWLRRLLTVQALTGARWVEVVRLRPEDCELDADPPAVWLTHRKGGERSRRRVLPVAAAEAVREQLRHGNAMWLWPGRPASEHRRYDGCWKALAQACRRAEVPAYSFHSVRRWAGTVAMRIGIPDRVAAEFLGHADASVIHHYQRVEDVLVQRIGDALATELSPGVPAGVNPSRAVPHTAETSAPKGPKNA